VRKKQVPSHGGTSRGDRRPGTHKDFWRGYEYECESAYPSECSWETGLGAKQAMRRHGTRQGHLAADRCQKRQSWRRLRKANHLSVDRQVRRILVCDRSRLGDHAIEIEDSRGKGASSKHRWRADRGDHIDRRWPRVFHQVFLGIPSIVNGMDKVDVREFMSYWYGPVVIDHVHSLLRHHSARKRRANSHDAFRQRLLYSAVPSAQPRRFPDGIPRRLWLYHCHLNVVPSSSSDSSYQYSLVVRRTVFTHRQTLSLPTTSTHCLYTRRNTEQRPRLSTNKPLIDSKSESTRSRESSGSVAYGIACRGVDRFLHITISQEAYQGTSDRKQSDGTARKYALTTSTQV
jgi:hypothetical protein